MIPWKRDQIQEESHGPFCTSSASSSQWAEGMASEPSEMESSFSNHHPAKG